jgi:hypothetical protein
MVHATDTNHRKNFKNTADRIRGHVNEITRTSTGETVLQLSQTWKELTMKVQADRQNVTSCNKNQSDPGEDLDLIRTFTFSDFSLRSTNRNTHYPTICSRVMRKSFLFIAQKG